MKTWYDAVLRALLTRTAVANVRFNVSARAFRNRLVVTTLLVLVVCAALVVIQALVPQAALFDVPGKNVHVRRWVLLLLVMVFGALGALITAIPAMAALPAVRSAYNFPLQQSFVKIAVGALTALVGIMVIGNAGVAGFSSVQAMLAAATVFGAGQQAVTRFLDKRAQTIIDKMPGASSK